MIDDNVTRPGVRHLLGSWRRATRRRYKKARHRLQLELAARFGPLPVPQRWVFLVGCYNSGTTLLHDLLATHPLIGSMPDEGQFFTDQLPVPRDLGLRRLWALDPDRFWLDQDGGPGIDVTRLARQWGARYDDAARPVLLEKSPTNAARTRWLQAHFRPSYFVGIVRDGRAVAEGIRRKTGHDLAAAARQWARSNEIMLRDFEHLEHKCVVTYEQLTEDPNAVVAQILAFLELPALSTELGAREWKIHEQRSPIVNMNARSIGALSGDDLRVLDLEAGTLLKRLGYVGAERTDAAWRESDE